MPILKSQFGAGLGCKTLDRRCPVGCLELAEKLTKVMLTCAVIFWSVQSMEKIKMVDLHTRYARIKPEIDAPFRLCLTSTAFIQGPQVAAFYAKRACWFPGAKHVIPCANGTDALQIAMMALEYKPGDGSFFRFIPMLLPRSNCAVGIDTRVCRRWPANIQHQSQITQKITAKTKAIVPVHLYGQCANMETILHIAKNIAFMLLKIPQSLECRVYFPDGTRKKSGTIGTIGTTSFSFQNLRLLMAMAEQSSRMIQRLLKKLPWWPIMVRK